jgi:hypothetical protein
MVASCQVLRSTFVGREHETVLSTVIQWWLHVRCSGAPLSVEDMKLSYQPSEEWDKFRVALSRQCAIRLLRDRPPSLLCWLRLRLRLRYTNSDALSFSFFSSVSPPALPHLTPLCPCPQPIAHHPLNNLKL